MTLFLVVLVCSVSSGEPCSEKTARAVNRTRMPAGIVICASPSMMEAASVLSPQADEYLVTRCELRRD